MNACRDKFVDAADDSVDAYCRYSMLIVTCRPWHPSTVNIHTHSPTLSL